MLGQIMDQPINTPAILAPSELGPVILALPKGRILKELGPVLARAGITPAPDCMNEGSRRLRFETTDPGLDVVRVRSFDVATFVAHGAAQIGVCGADVLMEFDYPEIYAPLDLGIGGCRISVAAPKGFAEAEDSSRWSRITVASKYPGIAQKHYAQRGIQAEIVHLNGAMELAPALGMSKVIVDLVDTGNTLRATGPSRDSSTGTSRKPSSFCSSSPTTSAMMRSHSSRANGSVGRKTWPTP
jgi:ATP phosphoribosyltransferase